MRLIIFSRIDTHQIRKKDTLSLEIDPCVFGMWIWGVIYLKTQFCMCVFV